VSSTSKINALVTPSLLDLDLEQLSWCHSAERSYSLASSAAVMASMYTDFMALRQSVEVPSDRSAEHISKQNLSHSALGTPSRSRIESNHAIDIMEEGDPPLKDNCGSDRLHDHAGSTIALSSTNKVAGQTVAPFLAKHIPEQYAHQGVPIAPKDTSKDSMKKNPNTKYCYRHRPDSKCRRTADEPTMENLQRVRSNCRMLELG
jgi:F-box/WD-40 domain protein MET30